MTGMSSADMPINTQNGRSTAPSTGPAYLNGENKTEIVNFQICVSIVV
jgi:hypothetical protein